MKTPGISTLKKAIIFLLLLCLFILDSHGQYQNSGLSLTNTYNSAVNWVDIDGDGDLDACISGDELGLSDGQGELIIFENNAIFDVMTITPIEVGDMTWCDFNNDSIPDLLYAGEATGLTVGIDTFYISGSSYNSFFSDFTPVSYPSVDWGDYDNDGDYDVLIAGEDISGVKITTLYQNNNGTFEDVQAGLPGVYRGKVGFIDYDLDQDLDIFICGLDVNTNKYSRLWQNNNGFFSITNDIFLNVFNSSFDWGDFNSDGYPDLVLIGYDGNEGSGLIYYNNAGNSFSESNIKVPGSRFGSSGFGDTDNDGDLDVFVSGYKHNPLFYEKLIFINDGSDSLKPADYNNTYLVFSHFQFGDYDNDNDLDFIVNGRRTSPNNGLTQIIEDTCSVSNSKPTAPQNLSVSVTGTDVLLTWNHSTDNNTPQKALTYNIYLGTTSKGIDIVSPHATISNGFRKISKQGYIQDTAWVIKDLPAGTYYWGVQSIDNSFAPSPFSDEATFEINDRFTENTYIEDPSTTSPAIYFDCDHDLDYDLVLYGSIKFIISENIDGNFSQSNYDTISNDAFNPIYTITPNDYDNNNLIDFSISGNYTVDGLLDSSIALFGYASDFNYDIIDSALVNNANFDYALWGDFNNDGLQDIITSGKTTNLGVDDKPVTCIFKNLGDGSFTEVSHAMRGFEDCGAVTGDFDNDMDIDIIIYGIDSTASPHTFLYINEGNFDFVEQEIYNNELFRSLPRYGIFTGDFDLNGELDVYMIGKNNQDDTYARVLLNNNLVFADANLSLRSWGNMSNFWADYDYDGDLDIFATSTDNSPDEIRIYINDNQSLEEIIIDIGAVQYLKMPFMTLNLDNEKGLDFLIKDFTNGEYIQYCNNWSSNDRVNLAPTNLDYERSDLDVILTWDKLTDCPGCTYNIWVGTHPDSVNIMSPMADKVTGFRYVIQPGNVYLNDRWRITDLPADTYYWSVQAIDLANTGGPWAEMDTIVLTNVNPEFTFDMVCLGDTTHFYDLSVATDNVVGWNWNFDDGSTSTIQNPKHVYAIADTFNVGLWAYSESGDSSMQSHDVIVMATPVADFSADIACLGTPTNFINNTISDGLTISNWNWDFDDGHYSIVEDPGTNIYPNSGEYLVKLIVIADNSCSDSIQKTVTVAAYPSVAVTSNLPLEFCEGDSTTLSVDYDINNSYQWLLNDVDITDADSSKFTAKLTGNYKIEVINNIGSCDTISSGDNVIAKSVPSSPFISYTGNITFCQGDSIELSVTYNPDYSYAWKLNTGDIGIDTNIYYAKSSGNYILEVSNSSGCVTLSSNSVDITVNDIPIIPSINLSGPTSFCASDSVIISVTNNPVYTYQWKNELGNISGSITNEITVKETGTYNLEVTNSSNCSVETEPVIVTVFESPSIPVIVYSGLTTFCNGDSIQLSVTNNTSLDYQWKLNTGDIGIDTNIYYAKSSGNYILEVSNSSGCVTLSSNSVDITVNDIPIIPSINLSGPTSFCASDSVIISVTNNPVYTYQWKNELGNISGSITNEITVKETGTYNLEVTNSSNCSVETEPVIVTVFESPSIPVIVYSGLTTFCNGDSIQLSVTNNTSLDYQWKLNTGAIGIDTNIYIAKSSGNYTLEVSNSSGCVTLSSNSVDVTVNEVPDKPVVSLSGLTGFCEGDSLILSADEHAGLTYQWCNENGEILNATSNQYVTYSSGDFYLDITNSSNCTNTSNTTNVTVSEMPLKPVIITTGYNIDDCPQEKIIFLSVDQATSLYNYQWKRNGVSIDGETESTIEDYLKEGDYSVIADNNGCANESDITGIYWDPELPEKPGIIATGPNVWYLACTNDKAQQYEWYYNSEIITGANDYLYVANQTLGTYFVKIAEENGCFVASDAVTIPLTATGIDDVNPFAGLKIYPNPTPGMFTIEIDNQLYGELFIFIYTQEAKEIFNIKFYKNIQHFKTQVDLSGQGSGLYVILLSLDNYKTERKLIIE